LRLAATGDILRHMAGDFDAARAKLKGPDWFPRFNPGDDAGIPLREAGLDHGEQLLIFQRGGERRALLTRQMAYHHVAQGALAGEPYLVTF